MSNINSKIIYDNYVVSTIDDYVGVARRSKSIFVALPPIASVPTGKVYIIKDEGDVAATYPIVVYTTDNTPIDTLNAYNININSGAINLVKNGNGTAWAVSSESGSSETNYITSGVVSLAVSVTGTDDAIAQRPVVIASGDYSSLPYRTIQQAIDALPKNISSTVTISVGPGNFTGFTLEGLAGKAVYIYGSWAVPVISSGTTSGTAGAGTGGTVINKPTGASNWPNDGSLEGLFVRITGGGGFTGSDAFLENTALITSHNTTQLVLSASLYGTDATTQFQIVVPGTILDTPSPNLYQSFSHLIGLVNCVADQNLARFKVDNTSTSSTYGLVTAQSQFAVLQNFWFNNCISLPSYGSHLNAYVTRLDDSLFAPYGQNFVLVRSLMGFDSSINCSYFSGVDASGVTLNGDSGFMSACTLEHGVNASFGGTINDSSAYTPLVLHNIHNFVVSGAISGTNTSSTYGAQIDGGGQFNIAGLAMYGSGSTPVLFENNPLNYTQLSGNGTTQLNGSFAKWGSGATVYLESVGVYGGSQNLYGLTYKFDPAYKEITAQNTSPSITTATQIGYQETIVTAATAHGDAIRFFGNAGELILGGLTGNIWNRSGFNVRLFPHTGHKIYLAGAAQVTNAAITITNGQKVSFLTDNLGDWNVVVQ